MSVKSSIDHLHLNINGFVQHIDFVWFSFFEYILDYQIKLNEHVVIHNALEEILV